MRLKVRLTHLDAGGKLLIIMNIDDAEELGVRSLSRVKLRKNGLETTAIVNTTTRMFHRGNVGVCLDVQQRLQLVEGDIIDVELSNPPNSLNHIKKRLKGRKLTHNEIKEIIRDVVNGLLSDVELTSFVTSLQHFALDMDEATSLSIAMVESGQTLQLDKKIIVDKHSIGGVPGDKTTLLVVPIVASCGLTIPKCSSRAITSAAGTADRAEVYMPVNLGLEEMRRVLEKTDGCIVWGGALHLAPADDIFVNIEFPLSIDPLLLPSIMSKKKAVGSKFVVIDIPTGAEVKVKTMVEAQLLAQDFIELGRRLEMNVQCAITYGGQPVGHAIGPALEAREALENLTNIRLDRDLVDKATDIAGMLLEMAGIHDGEAKAMDVLKSGRAERKMREIIAEQGGNPNIKPEDIPVGQYTLDIEAENHGILLWIDMPRLVEIARLAGSPKDKGAGVLLHKKLGEKVSKGDKLFTIYSEKAGKLESAYSSLKDSPIMLVGHSMEMTLSCIKDYKPQPDRFMLDR
ncbi:MAG: AMP phosphorylase [Candidatus Bathyarchaeia archaeon]|nr:AMP phosphorylase [Candidatus Bathyarchaeota archaeon]